MAAFWAASRAANCCSLMGASCSLAACKLAGAPNELADCFRFTQATLVAPGGPTPVGLDGDELLIESRRRHWTELADLSGWPAMLLMAGLFVPKWALPLLEQVVACSRSLRLRAELSFELLVAEVVVVKADEEHELAVVVQQVVVVVFECSFVE